jgi:peptidoglycan hydrolase-like protein with peptidoglycan-binding domain
VAEHDWDWADEPSAMPPLRRARRHDAATYTRRRLLVGAGGLTAAGLVAVAVGGRPGRGVTGDAATTVPSTAADGLMPVALRATSTTAAPTTEPPTTTMPSTTSSTTTTDPQTLSEPLRFGSSGRAVVRLQDRLRELAFEPGPSDGLFGELTQQAVWAYEKLALGVPRDAATGRVPDELWQQMRTHDPIRPRRSFAAGQTSADHTEVYLPEQVVAFFDNDQAVLISHMSSGSGEHWRETVTISPGEYRNERGTEPIRLGLMGRSITPGGVYLFDRIVAGRRLGALGAMYDPAYFNYGIAIHGAENIPLEPASHGCVRVHRFIGERFHQFIDRADQVWVWDGEQEPEWIGQQPPPFDQIDPDWTDA